MSSSTQTRETATWGSALHAFLGFFQERTRRAELRDWSGRDLETLRSAGFGPLLGECLPRHEKLPSLIAEGVSNARLVELHRGVLTSLLKRLGGHVAPPVLFKGMAACDELYPDPSWRVFSDIDLLIPSRDQAAWATAITTMGGECTDGSVFGSRTFSARRYFQHAYRVPSEDPDVLVNLDLHQTFGPPQQYPVDHEAALLLSRDSERGPYRVLGRRAWACSLAIHQARTLFDGHHQDYVDLFLLLWGGEDLDVDRLIEAARSFRCLRALSVLVRNLQRVAPSGVLPDLSALRRFEPGGAARFGRQMEACVGEAIRPHASFIRDAAQTALLADSLPAVAHHFGAVLAKRCVDLFS